MSSASYHSPKSRAQTRCHKSQDASVAWFTPAKLCSLLDSGVPARRILRMAERRAAGPAQLLEIANILVEHSGLHRYILETHQALALASVKNWRPLLDHIKGPRERLILLIGYSGIPLELWNGRKRLRNPNNQTYRFTRTLLRRAGCPSCLLSRGDQLPEAESLEDLAWLDLGNKLSLDATGIGQVPQRG